MTWWKERTILSRCSFATILCGFIILWYNVISIERVPLPTLNDMLAPQPLACTLRISGSSDALAFVDELKGEMGKFKVKVQTEDKSFCTTDCDQWLKKERGEKISCSYQLHVSKGKTGLSLNDYADGWLQLADSGSVSKGVELLEKTWFQKLDAPRVVALAPLFSFSFFYVSEGNHRVSWDFVKDIENPLSAVFRRLNVAVDFDVESQVVSSARLTSTARGEKVSLSKIQGHFLQNANMWGSDIGTDQMYRPAPLINFAAFSPSKEIKVLDDSKQAVNSFFLQGWGAVAMMKYNSTDLAPVRNYWVGHIRRELLLLPEDPFAQDPLVTFSSHSGLAQWELLSAVRLTFKGMQKKASDNLSGVYSIVQELSNIEVPPRIGFRFEKAKEFYEQAQASARRGDVEAAMSAAKKSLLLSLEIQHDTAMVGLLHFSWEYTLAIYAPGLLPAILPLIHLIKNVVLDKWRGSSAQ